ncbi:MAG: methionyl-tRNA formyltransferase, partial [Bacteroidales bacterium]|nr:methionyl-tRNA formyltransferase [Bacteroidales bacterium]
MKVVFMGTSEFAVASLDAIVNAGYDVKAVVTVPDKPAGRGQQLRFSDVKNYAVEHQLPLLQPEKLKDESFLEHLRLLDADIFVVVAFRMLPEVVYAMPPKGTFNIHASLLPQYRGAAPINHAIMNGESETGVTAFFLNHEIDKGDIIGQTKVSIDPEETVGELHDRLMLAGAELAVTTLRQIEEGSYSLFPQSETLENELKPAPKIFKDDMLLDWNCPAQVVFNKIRGLSPYPAAFTRIKNLKGEEFTLKCFKAKILSDKSMSEPGTISTDGKTKLIVYR